MSKKSRNTSARAAKQRRQAKSRAVRQADQARTDWVSTVEAFRAAVEAGQFRFAGSDGTPHTVSLDQLHAHTNAELASDGEPPATRLEVVEFLYEDLELGALTLRRDGMWQSTVDYRAAQEEGPHV